MKQTLCLFFLLISCVLSANETERIIRFHSEIQIKTNGKIIVTERITLYANGDQIQRGIVRSIPVVREDRYGVKRSVDFEILLIQCNQQDQPYHVEKEGDEKSIYIGDRDVYLSPGIYEYMIRYASYGHIGFFDSYDELYWNVTGNNWKFPIQEASAIIFLPDSGLTLQTACYTGERGSKATDCWMDQYRDAAYFKTNESLAEGEGLTIAVSFPRDIISRPPPPTSSELFWEKYKGLILGSISFLIMFLYYFITWWKVGRDPEKKVVIPLFKSPYNWSPAMVRYVYQKKYDDKVFTSALVSMAVKGAIRIGESNQVYNLESVQDHVHLAKEEKVLFDTLFQKGKKIPVDNSNFARFSKANSKLTDSITNQLNIKTYFLKNAKYIFFATLLVFGLIFLNLFYARDLLMLSLLGTFPFALVGYVLFKIGLKKKNLHSILFFIMGIACFAPALTGFLSSFVADWLTSCFLLLSLISFFVYTHLIQAPTELGSQASAQLEGFRMYLKTAEENRLNLLTPPAHTPELFEKMLPFALALDVENEWGKKFNTILQQANYQPDWYKGNDTFTSIGFANSFSNTFNSSVSRAQVDPTPSSSSSGSDSWSSGSSGGGSSGGGGGGGGGGGW